MLTTKKQDESIEHQVYRKYTHTDRYLHAKSHNCPTQKISIINTFATRAIRVPDNEHLYQEIKYLKEVLMTNG